MPQDNNLPTSRVVRTAMLGRVVAGQAVRHVGTKVAIAGRDADYRSAKLEKRQAEAVRAIVTGLGTMRGAAMKLGQMLALVDIGLFPEEIREDMQRAMVKLLHSAPTVPFDKMRKVIEGDLGGKLSKFFSEFDETPLAAASIGQVYRARLHDGRRVAVKVQYPGIDKAIRADLRNLALILKAGKVIAPNVDWTALSTELRERMEEELDYGVEAQNHRRVARLYRGHPFITVPEVIGELCGAHVLVTEFFDGRRFEEIRDRTAAAERNRVAEIMFRFHMGSLYLHRQFSPDPHPGNFLVGADGRVAFLDFGIYKHLDRAEAENQRALMRAVLSDSPSRIHAELSRGGIIADGDGVPDQEAYDFIHTLFWWASTPGEVTLAPDVINDAVLVTINPAAAHFDLARKQSMPADQAVVLRMMLMVIATAGQLRATCDWHQILREWLDNAAPVGELGRADAEFRGVTVDTAV
ncbi:ABC1 kinase family protein [Nocardia vulneris]|uniref:ATP-binding protein n=1 Tax=Nocardia vulneris TaxID=1141657 RepID=A0ABR4ZNM1_9NOCA|nr:AarF/ABC1/UbiB kinase family protein [Nocardia vulneris]KIA66793.1 ATP-binding protein [Nocardia vulneris]